jgi:hypothetical protein
MIVRKGVIATANGLQFWTLPYTTNALTAFRIPYFVPSRIVGKTPLSDLDSLQRIQPLHHKMDTVLTTRITNDDFLEQQKQG